MEPVAFKAAIVACPIGEMLNPFSGPPSLCPLASVTAAIRKAGRSHSVSSVINELSFKICTFSEFFESKAVTVALKNRAFIPERRCSHRHPPKTVRHSINELSDVCAVRGIKPCETAELACGLLGFLQLGMGLHVALDRASRPWLPRRHNVILHGFENCAHPGMRNTLCKQFKPGGQWFRRDASRLGRCLPHVLHSGAVHRQFQAFIDGLHLVLVRAVQTLHHIGLKRRGQCEKRE